MLPIPKPNSNLKKTITKHRKQREEKTKEKM